MSEPAPMVRGDALSGLTAEGAPDASVVMLGIRHHSPACARAVRAALEALRPSVVLIEGPRDFTELSEFADPELATPVALFSFVALPPERPGDPRKRYSAWFPVCDYSPELVALRWGQAAGVETRFCDLGLRERLLVESEAQRARAADGLRPLAEEPALAGAWLDDLCARTGARDHEDLWEVLFEQGPRSWRQLFQEVAVYGATLRAGLPTSQLVAEGHVLREQAMAAACEAAATRPGRAGPVVLVCGSMHIAGIRQLLADGTTSPALEPLPKGALTGSYLTSYDFTRMAALRYASGMPWPAWLQAHWEASDSRPVWLVLLAEAARLLRKRGFPVGTSDLGAASEMIERLSRFRGHPEPTRLDVLDGVRSTWIKGEWHAGQGALLELVEEQFRGDRVGQLGGAARQPPLVRQVDERLAELKFPGERQTREFRDLSPSRKAIDQRRAQALTRLRYLDIGYGRLRKGPDYLLGANLGVVGQRWEVGWDVESRARLLLASTYGATLEDAAAEKLREKARLKSDNAGAAASRLREALALGLPYMVEPLLADLGHAIDQDTQLNSVLSALEQLVLLSRFRDVYGGIDLPALMDHVAVCWRRSLWLLGDLPRLSATEEPSAIRGLRAAAHAATTLDGQAGIDAFIFDEMLCELLGELSEVPGIEGCVAGLLWRRDDQLLPDEVASRLVGRLQSSSIAPTAPGRFLGGLLAVARRSVLDNGELQRLVAEELECLEEPSFLAALPDLRRAATGLTPWESARFGEALARTCGGQQQGLSDDLPLAPETLGQLLASAEAVEQGLHALGLRLKTPPATQSDHAPAEAPLCLGEPLPRALLRFRLILGRYAESSLSLSALAAGAGAGEGGAGGGGGGGGDGGGSPNDIDDVLGFLYDREYDAAGRGMRGGSGLGGQNRSGGRGASTLTVPDWLDKLEQLFPRKVSERLEGEALSRYGLNELLSDERVLARCSPSMNLLEAVLKLKGRMKPAVLKVARDLIRRIIKELADELRQEFRRALSGGRVDPTPVPRPIPAGFDPGTTIRRNLRHWDAERRILVVHQPWFRRRRQTHLDWEIIVCVDQSGSMLSSTVHAGITASIFAGLPGVRVKLVAFDTAVIDLSEQLPDPVEVLMSVQLGGGTDIGKAMGYCRELVERPARTLMVLITDLYEGGSPVPMLRHAQELVESGVKLLVLAALDDRAQPAYDRRLGAQMVALGAEVGAMTPDALVRYVGEVLR